MDNGFVGSSIANHPSCQVDGAPPGLPSETDTVVKADVITRKASEKAENTGKETLTDVTGTETGTQKTGIKNRIGGGIGSGIENETDPEAIVTAESREAM